MAPSLPDRRTLVREAIGPPAVAGRVFAAAVDAPPPQAGPPTEADWAAWLDAARDQRLASMTVSAVRRGRVEPPPPIADALLALAFDETTGSLAADRAALETIAVLEGVGLHPVLLKGASIADRFYPRAQDRPTRDVDLLLPEAELGDAWTALHDRGHRPPASGMDPSWVSRYAKGRTLIGPDGTEVDLHRTLTVLPFGLLLDLDVLQSCVTTTTVGGRGVRVLSAEATFVHACLHAALTFEPGVIAHLDVVVTSHHLADAEVVRRLVGGGPLTSVLRAAVAEAELVGSVDPAASALVAGLPPSGQGDRLLAWHRRRHPSFVATLVRSTPYVGGTAARVKYGLSVGIGLARMAAGRSGDLRRPSDV